MKANFDWSTDSANRYHRAKHSTFFYLFIDKSKSNGVNFYWGFCDHYTYLKNKFQDINKKIGNLNYHRPIAYVKCLFVICLVMQKKVTTIERWLQVLTGEESTRLLFCHFPNGKTVYHYYCGWFTLKMQENREKVTTRYKKQKSSKWPPEEVFE